ncbi:SWIM zinc finger family protein [Gordonia sp. PDNC005]|uniref:SWIM zinc finger family protein n=1 Tax=unclassified Gordonia (in: high G+C Gram-positive bacteria) TaxID=2657482 RepID=UPI0019623276|nr:SWIM zinc finger family protein [Gordonia sp. PDNC005]QRY61178.1 SWIM zinc finger family protein [Gordonia sp. PDNC005]
MTGRARRAPVRGYGISRWGRAFVDAVEAGTDHRHVTGARRYFRDRHVDGMRIVPGRVTSSVRGSQLDPFDVILTCRTVDADTVVALLRAQGAVDDLLALARGEQPPGLGGLIAPTESADVESSCTCPDEAPRCIHVLATVFEVAAEIDRRPTALLQVMGTDLPELLACAGDEGGPSSTTELADDRDMLPEDFYGDRIVLPPPPPVPAVDALADLDAAVLRSALRASGVPATQLAEAVDDLDTFYRELRRRS